MALRTTGLSAGCLWIALAVTSAAGCGTRTVGGDTPRAPTADAPAGDGAEAEPSGQAEATGRERVLHLAIEVEDLMNVRNPDAAQTRVSLVTTDETGSADRRVLGVFAGVCAEADAGTEEAGLPRPALVAADCEGGARATRIRVVRDGGSIVALRAWIDEAEDPDGFPSYDEIDRFEVSPGAQVVTGDPPR